MLFDGAVAIKLAGVLASVAAMLMSSLGYILAKKWSAGIDVFSLTAWQLIAGGLVLLPAAIVVEGRPPTMDTSALLAFGYVTVVATAIAFAAWFTGLRHLSAGTVGLVGLLNPITGVLLGTAVAGETLAPHQIAGLALVLGAILLGQPLLRRLWDHRQYDDMARRPTGRARAVPGRHRLGRAHAPQPGGDVAGHRVVDADPRAPASRTRVAVRPGTR
jgi:probable blue pigment (indigoidine) exporter